MFNIMSFYSFYFQTRTSRKPKVVAGNTYHIKEVAIYGLEKEDSDKNNNAEDLRDQNQLIVRFHNCFLQRNCFKFHFTKFIKCIVV